MRDDPPGSQEATGTASFFSGLSGRLLLLTVGFVLFAVAVIYPLLAASYRNGWLLDRAQAAQIAVLAVEAAPDGRVSDGLSRELLGQAQVISVAVEGEDFRELVLASSVEVGGPLVQIDMRTDNAGPSVFGTFEHLLAPRGRFLQILVVPSMTDDASMEVIVPEAALRKDLLRFSRTLLVVSLMISGIVGALIYLAIYRLVVRPMQGLTGSLVRFAASPEEEIRPFRPGRSDEMQTAYRALQDMQRQVSAFLRQRKRLADLGEAMAKINHDLRNSLSAAQIVSEGLSQSDDPRVKRAAPRLERAIERAIGLAEATLRYGRADPPGPSLQPVNLAPILEEAALEALAGWPAVSWKLECPGRPSVLGDPEHIHRIIANLMRNAARAVSEQECRRDPPSIRVSVVRQDDVVSIDVADNGPGLPPAVVPRLFLPFSGSASRDGAGLGLAIARELARGMRGDVELVRSGVSGAVFRLTLPARSQ